MRAIIPALRASIHYVRAGIFADNGDYLRAREHMDGAFAAAGPGVGRASVYEFFLRAARIERKLGESSRALAYLRGAAQRIERSNKLSEMDRKYLLDFCDLSVAEVRGIPGQSLRLKPTDHDGVCRRLRRYYPIEFIP